MRERALQQLLVRYRFGRIGPERLEAELRDALSELEDRAAALLDETETVRLWNEALLLDAEQSARRTASAIDTLSFHDAIRQLRAYERALDTIDAMIAAVVAADAAANAVMTISDVASTPQLRRLPVIASLAQLIDTSREYLASGSFAEARTVAEICSRIVACLLEQRESDQGPLLSERVERLTLLVARADVYLDDALAQSRTFDESVRALLRLANSRYTTLAYRLVTELEIEAASSRRFVAFAARHTDNGISSLGTADELRRAVAEQSWDGAVNYFWQRLTRRQSQLLEKQQQRAETAAANLDSGYGRIRRCRDQEHPLPPPHVPARAVGGYRRDSDRSLRFGSV
jgi:hypothetical protein